jgi:hypothetical protein
VPSTRSLRALNRATLARQGLLDRHRGSVADVIGRLAGLQAQHANPPYVALWSRRTRQTIADLEAALEDRSVVKATLMRTTLHIVAAADYPAFDAATAEGRLANWRPTAKRAGVDLDDLHERLLAFCAEPRSVADIETWLEDEAPKLAKAAPSGVRNAAFRVVSSGGGLVHVPPSGSWRSHDKPRYVAARVWLRDLERSSIEEALATATERYLAAYGPASIADIGKWLGRPRLPRNKAAVAALGDRIVTSTGHDGRELVDLDGRPTPRGDRSAPPRFLSRWDSALIGYDVRDRLIAPEHRSAVMKANADVLPTFLVDGFVAGTWSIERDSDRAVLRLDPVRSIQPVDRRAVEREGDRLVRYHEADADRYEVEWAD